MSDTTTPAKAPKAPTSNDPKMPNTTGDMVPLTPALVKEWLEGNDLDAESEDDFVDLNDAVRILSALTPEDALKTKRVEPIDNFADKTFGVLSVRWRKSTRSESGKGRYAIMDCVDSDGVPFMTTCGALDVILKLRVAQLRDWLPWQVCLRTSKTESGNTVKELVAPDKPF